VIKMTSILKREELTLLRSKYLPDIHEAYKMLVNDLNKISEKMATEESDDIWLTEKQQRRMLRKVYKDWNKMRNAQNRLRNYLRVIMTRLEEPLP